MLNALSDHDLALRYRDGDLAAFTELYRRYGRGLYGFIAWCAPHHDRVDQTVLDSWAALHEARGRYLASASFRTFLYQIARHRMLDPVLDPMPDATPDLMTHQHARSQSGMPEPAFATPLGRAVRALPEEGREALVLQQFSALAPEEIALVCGASTDTVEARLRDAMRTLRAQAGIDATDDDALSAGLRSLPQAAPPPELEPRLHAQARAALDHPARVAHDPVVSAPPTEADAAADDEEAPRPANPFGHLRVPMAVAATVVIGVTLALQLGDRGAPAGVPAAPAGTISGADSDPAAAIERIGALLDQHRDAEAREAWQAFRRLYPDAPAPAALRARIEAVPPAR
jgi:DNA-directed RNA polymerase specialized sigma24 family protein